jgi:rhamnulokinase
MAGRLDSDRLVVKEMVRLPNSPVWLADGLHWDVLRIHQRMLEGIAELSRQVPGEPISVGIDGWGVDYGLLDADGRLLGPPFHYRDERTAGRIEEADRLVGLSRIYEATGIQFMPYNTLYQLLAERESAAYRAASSLLLIPDLLSYLFTGQGRLERTNASTTQLVDARTGRLVDWLLAQLGLRRDLFAAPIEPGDVLGEMLAQVARGVDLEVLPLVIAVASHDTASAVLAVPARDGAFAYVISGTWSLVGLELEAPVITEESRKANFSNELGVEGSVRFLKDVMGHWMLQECVRTWGQAGRKVSLKELTTAAERCAPFRSLVDTELLAFAAPGDMPDRVRSACALTGEPVPSSEAELVRCVLDSMALSVAEALEEALHCADREVGIVHLLGGGAANELLLSLVAATTGREVMAGPVEASSIGNLLVQLETVGRVHGRAEMRELVRRSFPPVRVIPDPDLMGAAAGARLRLAAIRSQNLEKGSSNPQQETKISPAVAAG